MPGTIRIARACGCRQESWMGQKREKLCEHGNLFEKPAVVEAREERRRSKPRRSAEPKRDWSAARRKVEEESCYRICKSSDRKLEAAHIMGREHDEPKVRAGADGESFTVSKVLYVHRDRIVPLCGPFPEGCHGDFDERHSVNLLHYLTLAEQVQAVKDAGGIAPAWRHLAPVDHRAEIEASV